jgi:hypothetical protein
MSACCLSNPVQFASRCTSCKAPNGTANLVLQTLKFRTIGASREIPGGAGTCHHRPNEHFAEDYLMSVHNRSLFKREHTRRNVLKALAVVISTCNLHGVFPSKIARRWRILCFANVMPRPFHVRQSRPVYGDEETDGLSLIFIDFMFRSRHHSTEARPPCSFLRT